MMRHAKLLLYDQDPCFKKEIVSYLEKRNFQVLACEHEEQIIDIAKSQFPLYYVVNHQLVNSDLLEKLQAIYKEVDRPVHFLFLTDKEYHGKQILKNAQMMRKPFALSTLFERIKLFEPTYATKVHAKEMISKLTNRQSEELKGLEWFQSDEGIFEGNHFFVADGPTHDKHILITQCSHKGLGALMGIVLAHEVFNGMVRKGFAYEQVIREINRKLRTILPEEIHFYISYVVYIQETKTIHLFNGGAYPMYAYDKAHHAIVKHQGLHFNINSSAIQLSKLDVVHLDCAHNWTLFVDGAKKTQSIETLMEQLGPQEDKIIFLKEYFRHGGDFHLCIQPQDFLFESLEVQSEESTKGLPLDLDFSFSLNAESLKSWDPLPVIMHTLMEHQLLHKHRTEIFTILTELYTNALDHGVLQLDSALKGCHKGISQYYEQKSQRLLNLESGHVHITVKVKTHPKGGELVFTVEDSGCGFDFKKSKTASNEYSGRGLSLIEALCTKLEYEKNGTCVKATFLWA